MIMPADDPMLTMWQLTPDATAPREARLALRSWLGGLRIDSARGVGADIILAADELVTNAVMHGKPPVFLAARVDLSTATGPALVISVTDGGGSAPTPSNSAEDSESGRGLAIVTALAASVATSSTWNATQVCATFAAPELLVPEPRHADCNADSSTVKSGAQTGGHPSAPLSVYA